MKRRDFLTNAMIASRQPGCHRAVERLAGPSAKPADQVARCEPGGLAGAREVDHAQRVCRSAGRGRIHALRDARQSQGGRAAQAASRDLDHGRGFRVAEGPRHQCRPASRSIMEWPKRTRRSSPAMDTLDWAFRTAKKHGIGVLARPARRARQPERLGPQRPPGQRSAGIRARRTSTIRCGSSPTWPSRCKGYDNLIGFELLNEPRWDVPLEIIKRYYQDAYHRVREHIPKEKCAVVIHDAFRRATGRISCGEPEYQNVILDTHPYQCFTDDDRKRDLHGQVQHALSSARSCSTTCKSSCPCIVGEWSCALPPRVASAAGRAWHSTWPCGPTATPS